METADFLVELGTEELPPKSLLPLAKAFHKHLLEQLKQAELEFSDSEYFATPRRLAVRVLDLAARQPDKTVERLGPAVAAAYDKDGNTTPAAVGFAKSCQVSVEQLEKVTTDKGERLGYTATVSGKATTELLGKLVEGSLKGLPIPKMMRWGDSDLQFIRPPHWLLMLFGDQVIDAEILEQKADRISYGHRFHSPGMISISSPNEYENKLAKAKVSACFEARKAAIRAQVTQLAKQHDATAVIDEDLLEEVTAIVEWPLALLGQFDQEFLEVPAEALIATMQADQKYFHLVDENNKLLPLFITIANIDSNDPSKVVAGNERVIRPRLADAKFFFDMDRRVSLATHIDHLKTVVFQKQLGTLFDKCERISVLAGSLAGALNAPLEATQRAAQLCKCDLMSKMVYEFPELQGIMGRYYAQHDGEPNSVSLAMEQVYMPKFAGDQLPSDPVGVALALADRIDTLAGIFAIGQAPTGTKDPYALRRAALGIIRILVEKRLDIDLRKVFEQAAEQIPVKRDRDELVVELLEFIKARLQHWFADKGFSAQVIQSVLALAITEPLDVAQRIEAVNQFNQLADSEALAAANKRVSNILSKASHQPSQVESALLVEPAEQALFSALTEVKQSVAELVEQRRYTEGLQQLASLRSVIDDFFDNVMVNSDDQQLKENRLNLLAILRRTFVNIADIALLQK